VKIEFGDGKFYLVRIVVSVQAVPAAVVTLYKSSKIDKYWRKT